MASFKEIGDTSLIEKKYIDKRLVYVESQEDVVILSERWFIDVGEKLEFIPAADGSCKMGGCKGVIRNVGDDRESGIIAFGIVDRDSLLADQLFDVLWETNDPEYLSAKPYGEYIYPLLRWEIENYLIEPDLIEEVIVDQNPDKFVRDRGAIVEEFLEDCEALLPVMAGCAKLHKDGKKQLDQSFQYAESVESVRTKLHDVLENMYESKAYITEFEEHYDNVKAFKNDTGTPEEKLSSLLRIVDGKRLFYRVKKRYGINYEIRFALARKLKNRAVIPADIQSFVTQCLA